MNIGDKVKIWGVIESKIEDKDGVEYLVYFDHAEFLWAKIRLKEKELKKLLMAEAEVVGN